ncbi:hypothetical protein C4D60_Mb01t31420 [Musa balbisiana]|uniref:Uncharacterized protein n=1 Tax=Musa balbisiana TaxID=52838 RepID=A0A4V6T4J0_MUSBA|nr:hypothetical protein C4D60_Mb01t31420 [Musa balbisiana]
MVCLVKSLEVVVTYIHSTDSSTAKATGIHYRSSFNRIELTKRTANTVGEALFQPSVLGLEENSWFVVSQLFLPRTVVNYLKIPCCCVVAQLPSLGQN